MLPDWLEPDTVRWLILGVIGAVVFVMFLVIRTIQRLAMRVALLAVLAGLGLSLWVQRSDLQDCVSTCECSLYGRDLQIDYDQLPETVQNRIDSGDTAICSNVVRED